MDVGSAVRLLLRRWLVVLIGLLLTAGACGYLYQTAEPRYQATGRMLLLLPPNARGAEEPGSPFLYLPNGLNVLARIVSVEPNSRSFRDIMSEQNLTSTFEVAVDPTTPIISVSVEGEDPENVIATRDGLITALNDALLRIQEEESVPQAQTAHTRVYANEDVPLRLGGDWTRAVLAAGAAGGIVTLLAAFAIDRLIALARDRRARREAAAADTPGDPHNDSEPATAATIPAHADAEAGADAAAETEDTLGVDVAGLESNKVSAGATARGAAAGEGNDSP